MTFGIPLAIIVYYMVQTQFGVLQKLWARHGPEYSLEILKNIYKVVLKVKFRNFQHTIIMKFGIPLAIIVHYTVHSSGVLQKRCARHGP